MEFHQLQILYGTDKTEENTTAKVLAAVKVGYRAIDTANGYGQYTPGPLQFFSAEEQVGSALELLLKEGYKRSDFWIQTKYRDEDVGDSKEEIEHSIMQQFNTSLFRLNTTIDSYLLHFPYTLYEDEKISQKDLLIWEVFEEMYNSGKVKAIGICNAMPHHLEQLIQQAKVKPMIVQDRYYISDDPFLRNTIRKNICQGNNIQYQSYQNAFDNNKADLLENIARKYNISSKAVIYSFEHQIGIVPLTGTVNEEHMKENLHALALNFTDEEIRILGEEKCVNSESDL